MQRGKVGFRRAAADSAVGLIRSANMLLRGLHLRTALGSPASRMRQEFNDSSQYRKHSLHKIITFLWDKALGKPKPKGDASRPLTTSITYCAVHKTYQPSDPQQRRYLTPCMALRSNTQQERCGRGYRSFSCSSYTKQVTLSEPNPSCWSPPQDGCSLTVPSVLLINSC